MIGGVLEGLNFDKIFNNACTQQLRLGDVYEPVGLDKSMNNAKIIKMV